MAMGGEVVQEYGRWLDVYIPVDRFAGVAELRGAAALDPRVRGRVLVGAPPPGATAAGVSAWHRLRVHGSRGHDGHFRPLQGPGRSHRHGFSPARSGPIRTAQALTSRFSHGTAVAEIFMIWLQGPKLVLAAAQSPVQRASFTSKRSPRASPCHLVINHLYELGRPGDGSGAVADAHHKRGQSVWARVSGSWESSTAALGRRVHRCRC